jgi:ferredoxin-fold anticodon binding domain-containing protein
MTKHKYIVTQINEQIFHVGRLRVNEDNYEIICTCKTLKAAKFVMEAIARLEEITKWRQ